MKYHVKALRAGTPNPVKPTSEALTYKQAVARAIATATEIRGSERAEDKEDVSCGVLHPAEDVIVAITGCRRGCKCGQVQAWKER